MSIHKNCVIKLKGSLTATNEIKIVVPKKPTPQSISIADSTGSPAEDSNT